MTNRYAVILAAGQGTRMKSKLYKVLHPVVGKPMVQHVIDQLNAVNLDKNITVVGFGAEKVQEELGTQTEYVVQKEQLGTAHAVLQAKELLQDAKGTTIVACGDTPLITGETFRKLVEHHEEVEASATILTANTPDPAGYGRVIRNADKEVERIVEHKDANDDELLVNEINTGTYCFNNQDLFEALEKVSNDNAQGEYYLPDVIEILRAEKKLVTAYLTPNFEETLGVNDRVALAEAERIMKQRINELHMRNGVTFIDPNNTYIEPDAVIGQDVTIYPGTLITGETTIEADAIIGPDSELHNATIGQGTVIKRSVVHDSKIGEGVVIGPFAHVRPESVIGNHTKVGNFVELKKTSLGNNSKVSHLSYMGDANIGEHVNIGCGTITVNYDGKNKHLTTIEDHAFVGCNSNLIAPVTIGEDSYVAAGSTINKDVPKNALSIARARQTNKEDYAERFKGKK
ncbi:bifunctional UDP-N-acetylglucosamine diphosphorylase/glucosamine-1-phosphate N-acetyltransferase GlmU [Oceanobacillus alkalisoli]|uniref:bifunctional UDP-N-acetylglucosamine diphosphorylase/glucosamine-1-phosphate N-acetyltransferase GlmU n=1 Tax=Oceanobacillus alkalisoli TaxID=2925113 RepID=UPI001F11BFA6|nr:bifunctional UDP-N-acetylglucosamine diphosphorylase/glucosamine-1-phosphate N-acetyltransferase GlmU [Oceanobacillus alkalisoli]MCF3944472.1 bifunctional UDP-N-acetylglucosamine diphosphorylase/glucosamine-1-phosphate N-acetyltransferase GlmU [Oceanobacillus alkalisoli]